MLSYYVEVAYRAFQRDSSHALPAPCLLSALAARRATALPTVVTGALEMVRSFPDSTYAHALALTEALLSGGSGEIDLLDTKVSLLARLRRYADVGPTFDLLVARDSARGTLAAYKMAISSARRAADTASMLRYVAAAATKFPADAQLAAEYNVLRQMGRMRSLIDSLHRAMRADPSLTLGYASLASIYGNLRQPDSTLAYIRRGLAHGVPRQTMADALRSLIGALLREAQISDGPDTWEQTTPVALDIDSVLSTPESKYLVALSLSRVAAGRLDLWNFYLPALEIGHGYPPMESIDLTRPPDGPTDPACPSIVAMMKLIRHADSRLANGGNRFAVETVPAIVAGLRRMHDQMMPFTRRCGSS
jgi:hypothetical protein